VFAAGFGTGAIWASAIGLVNSYKNDHDVHNHDDLVDGIVSNNGHAREYSNEPYDLTDGWPPGEVR
jgi:hypothetical protein